MDVTVTMLDGTSQTLRVNPRDTVGHLKAMIYQKFGVLPDRQKLVLVSGDEKKTLSNDSMSLSSVGLRSGSDITLLVTEPPKTTQVIQVLLKTQDGKLSKYDVKPDEAVTEFKKKVQTKERVQASQQRLLHQGREMMDGYKLSDYGVQNQSTIELMLHLRGG